MLTWSIGNANELSAIQAKLLLLCISTLGCSQMYVAPPLLAPDETSSDEARN
jgi:hypothetical protein